MHPQVGKWLIALGIQLGGGIESSTAWRLSAAVCGTLAVLMVARIGAAAVRLDRAGHGRGPAARARRPGDRACRASACSTGSSCSSCSPRSARCCSTGSRPADGWPNGRGRSTPGEDARLRPRPGDALVAARRGGAARARARHQVVGHVLPGGVRPAHRRVGHDRAPQPSGCGPGGAPGSSRTASSRASSWSASRSSSTSRRGGRWFTHPQAWGRPWADENPDQGVQWLPPALRSLWKYHQDMWRFHTGLETPHDYAAHPLGWIVQWRPTSFYYPTEVSGLTGQAGARTRAVPSSCSQAIVALGNPVLWWARAAAILVAPCLAVPLPRLARRRRPVRHRRRLAAVVRLRAPHDLHVLLGRVRAVGRADARVRARPDGRPTDLGPAREPPRGAIIGCRGVRRAHRAGRAVLLPGLERPGSSRTTSGTAHMWLPTWI